MVSWQASHSLPARVPLTFLSHLKLPFPSLYNACHTGYNYYRIYIFIIVNCGRIAPHRGVVIKCTHVCVYVCVYVCMYHCTCITIISDVLTNFSQVEIQLPKYILLMHRSVSNVMYIVRENVFLATACSVIKVGLITAVIIILR